MIPWLAAAEERAKEEEEEGEEEAESRSRQNLTHFEKPDPRGPLSNWWIYRENGSPCLSAWFIALPHRDTPLTPIATLGISWFLLSPRRWMDDKECDLNGNRCNVPPMDFGWAKIRIPVHLVFYEQHICVCQNFRTTLSSFLSLREVWLEIFDCQPNFLCLASKELILLVRRWDGCDILPARTPFFLPPFSISSSHLPYPDLNERREDVARWMRSQQGGPTLRANGKCSNENAIRDNDLMEYDLIG